MSNSDAQPSISLPSNKTLMQAAKLSIKIGRKICFYFYIDSCKGNVNIFKNLEEYTSPITNIYKEKDESEYIIVTVNTIYVLSDKCNVVKMPEEINRELEEDMDGDFE